MDDGNDEEESEEDESPEKSKQARAAQEVAAAVPMPQSGDQQPIVRQTGVTPPSSLSLSRPRTLNVPSMRGLPPKPPAYDEIFNSRPVLEEEEGEVEA